MSATASLHASDSPRASFLGPAGTFTHAAAERYFSQPIELVPQSSIEDVFAAVAGGETRYGVVPVENSTEGAVNNTQDCLLDWGQKGLQVIGEIELPIRHQLMGKAGQALTRIASHRQSLAQCRNWLRSHYPDITLQECASNAQAAEIASQSEHTAAIGSRKSAQIYGLDVLVEDIQDRVDNRTRFLVLCADPDQSIQTAPSGFDKTSLIVLTSNEPGALFRLLQPFEQLQVSLTKIETRPSRETAWEYVFFMDFEGHVEDDIVKELFARLAACSAEIRMLGSYPRHRSDAEFIE
jgi:chorismate mutase/prephenate dehydratase